MDEHLLPKTRNITPPNTESLESSGLSKFTQLGDNDAVECSHPFLEPRFIGSLTIFALFPALGVNLMLTKVFSVFGLMLCLIAVPMVIAIYFSHLRKIWKTYAKQTYSSSPTSLELCVIICILYILPTLSFAIFFHPSVLDLDKTPITVKSNITEPYFEAEPPYFYRPANFASLVPVAGQIGGAFAWAGPISIVITAPKGEEKLRADFYSLVVEACHTFEQSRCDMTTKVPDPEISVDTDIPIPSYPGVVVHASDQSSEKIQSRLYQALSPCFITHKTENIPRSIARLVGPSQSQNVIWFELGIGPPWKPGGICS